MNWYDGILTLIWIAGAAIVAGITVWINLCDREPEREDEVMELVRKHVMQFFDIYRK